MDNVYFPSVDQANEEGLLAIGGDLSVKRLVIAYQSGIFPWFNKNEPILWWSPDPRFILYPETLHVSKSMKSLLRKNAFKVTFNTAFEEVIKQCALMPRNEQEGTWITNEMIEAYNALNKMGFAKSIEVWQEDILVGGLYGIDLGEELGVFCGESMFSKVSNASKYGFIHWVEYLKSKQYKLIDCQVYSAHLETLGAQMISRDHFLEHLKK